MCSAWGSRESHIVCNYGIIVSFGATGRSLKVSRSFGLGLGNSGLWSFADFCSFRSLLIDCKSLCACLVPMRAELFQCCQVGKLKP